LPVDPYGTPAQPSTTSFPRWLVASIVVAAVLVIGGGIAFGLAIRDEVAREEAARTIGLDKVRAGDCLLDSEEQEVTDVRYVPCDLTHDLEVFAVVQLPDGEWPGQEQVDQAADEACGPEYAKFVGVSVDDSSLDYTWFGVLEEGWRDGDRSVICVLFDPRGEMTGSRRGSGA
jgi:hypothetical protein